MIALMMWAMMATAGLAPGCHHAAMEATSGSPPFPVIECYLRHVEDHQLVIINDGSDGDFDAGDVLLGEQVPA